jgi:cation diffusion facilitator family transporter
MTSTNDGHHGVGDGQHVHGPDAHRDLGHAHDHPSGLKGILHGWFVPHSHDASDSIDDALEASNAGVHAVKIGLLGLAVTAVLQIAVFAISGSVALLADTIHNFSDALTAIPLWVAFVVGRRAASRRYTYGFGRIEDLAGLFIVAMIALSAIVAGYESIRRLFEPQPLQHLGWVFVAGLIGFAGNELVAVYRIRVGRQIGSAALVADGVHARTDGFTSLAVVIGVVGVWLGLPLADPVVGLLISASILVLLFGTGRDIGRRLLDGVDPALTEQAERALRRVPGVQDVADTRLRWLGHRLSVEATVATDPTMPVAQFHSLEHRADLAVRQAMSSIGTVRISPGPACSAESEHPAPMTNVPDLVSPHDMLTVLREETDDAGAVDGQADRHGCGPGSHL